MHRLKRISSHLSVHIDSTNIASKSCLSNQIGLGKKIALVGSGVIGRNWAVLFARAGYNVTLFDISESQLKNALIDLETFRVPTMQKYDMLFGSTSSEVLSRISTTTNLSDALRDAILVQEGVPENPSLKQKVFQNISNTLHKLNNTQCIISSSSSTIIPSRLIKKMKYFKSNLIVAHPVNPPFAIPVVELCPSPLTNENILNKAESIMKSIGLKTCKMLKEANGFIVNRLQYALLQAAYQCVSEGVATPADIDLCVKHGLGLRWSFMGPFETIHLNAPNGVNDYCDRYVEACLHPVLSEMFGKDGFEKWKPEIWNKIHKNMEETFCKASDTADKCKWRDGRLLELAKHKREQNEKDNKL